MNYKIVLFLFCLVPRSAYADSTTKLQPPISIHIDTLCIQTTDKTSKNDASSKDMPWKIAGFIGVITVLTNIGISWMARKTANKQMEASERVAQSQIENSMNIALQQMQHAQNIALIDFNKTLSSKNRQDWINEVRKALAEYVSGGDELAYMSLKDGSEDMRIMSKVDYNESLLQLLLHPGNTLHKKLIEELAIATTAISKCMDTSESDKPAARKECHERIETVVITGREMLYQEWEEIQKALKPKEE